MMRRARAVFGVASARAGRSGVRDKIPSDLLLAEGS